MATVEAVNDALFKAFDSIPNAGIDCIVYVFNHDEGGGGTGFNSKNCDAGDAMVAIKRIAEEFGIDLERLAESM